VEDLTVVLYIRVITIGLVGTREVIRDIRPNGGGIAWQGEGSQGSWEAGDSNNKPKQNN